jgi:hypothetical protein
MIDRITNAQLTTEALPFAKPLLCAVHIGTVIESENTLFKVVKKYNDFVWQLKAENGEIVNMFYALSQRWSLHCT